MRDEMKSGVLHISPLSLWERVRVRALMRLIGGYVRVS
jgi:hypothetical protein